MPRIITFTGLLVILLGLTACSEKLPEAEWELTIDGDVDQEMAFSYQDIARQTRFDLTDVPTLSPVDGDERASWSGTPLRLLLREAGSVEYNVHWFALITYADETSRRYSLADLRGALLALKDGEGNWLAEVDEAPIRLIVLNKPSDEWLAGPVRITIQAP